MDANSLLQVLNGTPREAFAADNAARVEVLRAIRGLQMRLETKWETFTRISWQGSMLFNALLVAEDLKLFTYLDADGLGIPKSSAYLAEKSLTPVELIQRVFRHLAAMMIVEEVSQDMWKSTPISQAYSTPEYSSGIRAIDWMFVPNFQLARYLRQTSYKVPNDSWHCAWQLGTNDPANAFEYLSKYPEINQEFNQLMVGLSTGRPRAWDIMTDESSRIQDWLSNNYGPVLADLGAGVGHDLERLLDRYRPLLQGATEKLILLDRPRVISTLPATTSPEICAREIDFFTQSPPKNALFYHYSFIFHDWPDNECRTLLELVRPSMMVEKSRVVIRDYVIPKTGADPQATAMDLLMMSMIGAKERTEDEWRSLIESVQGFKVDKIHLLPGVPEGVIEVKRVA